MIVNVKKLVLPAGRLPTSPQEQRTFLDGYFDDLLASVKTVPDGWEIDLNWPTRADYYVDPNLEQGLKWWRAGTEIRDIPSQVYHSDHGLIALRDSWTLYSWSKWLTERHERGLATHNVVILHVDDHNDLMTPRLTSRDGIWRDTIFSEIFDLYEPNTVQLAILRGVIGVGSFISPIIHTVPYLQMRHLSQSAPADNIEDDYLLVRQTVADQLLDVIGRRPSIGIFHNGKLLEDKLQANIAGPYRLTHRLDYWLADLPVAPILLHIDMDYFNNRYNGNSDWSKQSSRHDPDFAQILRKIDDLFDALSEAQVVSRIENVTVALSPGFFPAELWEVSIAQIKMRLTEIGWAIANP
jgi:hypothetical protein